MTLLASFGDNPRQWTERFIDSSRGKTIRMNLKGINGVVVGRKWLSQHENFICHSPFQVKDFKTPLRSADPLPVVTIRPNQRSFHIARDWGGFHPLYFAETSSAYLISSRKEVLWRFGCEPERFDPSQVVKIGASGTVLDSKITYTPPSLRRKETTGGEDHKLYKTLKKTISSSLNNINPDKIAIAFSGGIDSSLIALAASDVFDKDISLITVGSARSHDRELARETFQRLKETPQMEHLEVDLKKEKVKKHLQEIVERIESPNPLQLELALPFFFVRKKAAEINADIVLAGQGADELFMGYHKFVRAETHEERLKIQARLLENMAKRNLERDFKTFYPVPVLFPYLSKKMIAAAAAIPPHRKIDEQERKKPLKRAITELGFPELSKQRKKAMQYGSGAKDILVEIAEERGLDGITQLAEEEFKSLFRT